MSWNEAIPSSTSPVGSFPAWARTVWATVAAGMAVEHYWNGSGGGSEASAGELLPGASRAFVAAQSASSAPGSQMTGRLFYASDVSRLLVYDSTGTYLAGTASASEHATDAGTGYWGRQSGSFTTNQASGTTDITFPVAFLQIPSVAQTWQTGGVNINGPLSTVHTQSTTTKFRSVWSSLAAAPGSFSIFWEALGPIGSSNY